MVFGINSDGVSLHTFYATTRRFNPTILLVKDTRGGVFGGFATEEWRAGKHFYGTGESFLFRFGVSRCSCAWESRRAEGWMCSAGAPAAI